MTVEEMTLPIDQIICGDCLDVMPSLPDGCADMILADVPYGTTACKWDSIIPPEPMWKQLKRIIKTNGAIVMTASQPFTTTLIASNMKMFKYCWVWDKVTARGHLAAKKVPMKQHEDIAVFYAKAPTYNPQMVKRPPDKIERRKTTEYKRTEICQKGGTPPTNVVYDKWYPKTIITISNAASSVKSVHPTQKPVALMEYLIKTYTNEGETVLDFAMGSGTTGVACRNLNRKFIGIELNSEYVEIAKKRLNGEDTAE